LKPFFAWPSGYNLPMVWNVLKIRRAFGGKLLGSVFMQTLVCQAVLLLPSETIEFVTSHVWFFSTSDDAWAYTFDGNDAKNKHFIFLSDELLSQDKSQIQHTILHEIGHVILKHKNSIGRRQTQSEIKIQEREADNFAKKYLT
jgi:hypothetical protein